MATGTKLSPATERDKAAASSGLRRDEPQTEPRKEPGPARSAAGDRHETRQPVRSSAADGPDPALIERLAYTYWEERGRPDGSADEDWFRAEEVLRKDLER